MQETIVPETRLYNILDILQKHQTIKKSVYEELKKYQPIQIFYGTDRQKTGTEKR